MNHSPEAVFSSFGTVRFKEEEVTPSETSRQFGLEKLRENSGTSRNGVPLINQPPCYSIHFISPGYLLGPNPLWRAPTCFHVVKPLDSWQDIHQTVASWTNWGPRGGPPPSTIFWPFYNGKFRDVSCGSINQPVWLWLMCWVWRTCQTFGSALWPCSLVIKSPQCSVWQVHGWCMIFWSWRGRVLGNHSCWHWFSWTC